MPTRPVPAAVVAIAVLGAAITPAAAAMPGPLGAVTPHAPILIDVDAKFTAANGVRSGTGTPADPFVIRGWHVTGSSSAITVKNVDSSFVVRDNLVVVSGNGVAIAIDNARGASAVVNNDVRYATGAGIQVKSSVTLVRDNSVQGAGETYSAGIGIDLNAANGQVLENVVSESVTGIKARYGNPRIASNNVGEITNGVLIEHAAAGTNVSGNVVANGHGVGIKVNYGTNVSVYGNLVEHVNTGLEFWNCITNEAHSNTVQDTAAVGVIVESCNMTVKYNVIADGKAGVQVWQSDAVLDHNEVRNHLAIGVEWMMSEGTMFANFIHRNAYGIYLQDTDEVKLRFNVLENNTYGLHVPYVARQSIPYMQGNLVNGRSVDGWFDPGQRAYYYRAANVAVAGGAFDSGFGAGYYGATTSEGAVTLYEVDTATISASSFSHNRIGVYAVNSFNVQVRGSVFVNNEVGVELAVLDSMGTPVPRCAGFVKNTTIVIDLDPPATFGVRNLGCYMGIYNSTIRNVDTGIYFDSAATGVIAGNTITGTTTAVHLLGNPQQANDLVLVHANAVVANKVGVLLVGSGADLARNRIESNTREGVRLESGAHPILVANAITRNRDGVLDATPCGVQGATCSRIPRGEGNLVSLNAKSGLVLNGAATLRDNRFNSNGERGAELRGIVTWQRNDASSNGLDGAFIGGTTTVSASTFNGNGRHGAVIQGTASLRDSTFSRNVQAGISASAQWITGIHLDVSYNFDGIVVYEGLPSVANPTVPYPYFNTAELIGYQGPVLGNHLIRAVTGSDPIFIHRSVIEENERNAVRAGPAVVNMTHNYWGTGSGPTIDTGVTGQWGNSISPVVHHVPWYADRPLTRTGPVAGL